MMRKVLSLSFRIVTPVPPSIKVGYHMAYIIKMKMWENAAILNNNKIKKDIFLTIKVTSKNFILSVVVGGLSADVWQLCNNGMVRGKNGNTPLKPITKLLSHGSISCI